jgi:chemotaxis protein CheD
MNAALLDLDAALPAGTGLSPETGALEAGRLIFARGPLTVRALVRSGIVVLVGDFAEGIAGVVHFVLPDALPEDTDLRCGGVAVPALVDGLRHRGGRGLRLVAEVYGGAHSRAARDGDVGRANAVVAVRLLTAMGVPVRASDMGGGAARRLELDLGTGHVTVDLV